MKFLLDETAPIVWLKSLPARGAWIEILGYSPKLCIVYVAPRTGSVD